MDTCKVKTGDIIIESLSDNLISDNIDLLKDKKESFQFIIDTTKSLQDWETSSTEDFFEILISKIKQKYSDDNEYDSTKKIVDKINDILYIMELDRRIQCFAVKFKQKEEDGYISNFYISDILSINKKIKEVTNSINEYSAYVLYYTVKDYGKINPYDF